MLSDVPADHQGDIHSKARALMMQATSGAQMNQHGRTGDAARDAGNAGDAEYCYPTCWPLSHGQDARYCAENVLPAKAWGMSRDARDPGT